MTDKKLFGLIAATLALVLSACANVSGSPRGNFAFNGENLVMYQGSSFCFNTDTKIKTPAGGEINVAKGSEIVASQVLTLNVKNGDISANAFSVRDCSTVVASPTNSQLQTPAPTAVLTQTAALTQTGNLTPTAVPTVQVAATAAPVASKKGIKYQYDAGCKAASDAGLNPMDYPACILQKMQSGDLVGTAGVVEIQKLYARMGQNMLDAVKIELPNTQPGIFWCPAGVVKMPPDAAFPLAGTSADALKDKMFVVDAGTGGPVRAVESADPKQPCSWGLRY